jgi:NAD(P)-dependent dehydrogenase (short-subunit alcohol dehydrogenase family)
MRVVIGDVDAQAATEAAAAIGSRAAATTLDVRDEGSFRDFLAFAETTFGPVEVLINNAGIMPIGPFTDEPVEVARRALEINLLGCLIGMKVALPAMVSAGRGHILNVSSVAGKSPVPGGLTYAATKAAVVSATETARVEYAGTGVDFTCVMPSFTNTDLVAGTSGTRFIKNIEPTQVATAIRDAIARPRADVYVPGSVGVIAKTTPLLGRRLRDAINRGLKADRTFLEIDQGARADYTKRITAPPTPNELEPGPPPD